MTRTRLVMLAAALVVLTLAAYGPVRTCQFVGFDDYDYVAENPTVRAGLTGHGLVWAMTPGWRSNWHPLAWMSHMLDCQLFGPRPGLIDGPAWVAAAGWHHVTNLLLHLASTVLLFLALVRMTRAPWRSALVAALFAVHPLHVESVAWISERKDVLSTFFGMLALLAYVRYTERPSVRRYLPVFGLLALGLMAKPMLVTLPFLLLLLDYWPLGRLGLGRLTADAQALPPGRKVSSVKGKLSPRANARPSLGLVLLEKLPLLALAAASSIVTFMVQNRGGAMDLGSRLEWPVRLGNAVVSYATYLGKMLVPTHLGVFYPYNMDLPMGQIVGAAALLVVATGLAIVLGVVGRRPYVLVGWLWYLGALVPVIGLVQVGEQAMADRYTYVPMIGIFLLIAWGVGDLAARWPRGRAVLGAAAGAAVLACAVLTFFQVRTWTSTETLFTQAIRAEPHNAKAHTGLGRDLATQGRLDEAINHFYDALAIDRDYAPALNNLGSALCQKAATSDPADPHREAALELYQRAVEADPLYFEAHYNLGMMLGQRGHFAEAERELRKAVSLNPESAAAHNNLGTALAQMRRPEDAVAEYRQAIRIDPDYFEAHFSLGWALVDMGQMDEALREFGEAQRIRPDRPEPRAVIARIRAGAAGPRSSPAPTAVRSEGTASPPSTPPAPTPTAEVRP